MKLNVRQRIKQYFKNVLGITKLENEINRLEKVNYSIADKIDIHGNWLNYMQSDNKLILRHLEFLNSQFSVVADINNPKYEPSIVVVLRRGKEEIVKTYVFDNATVEQVHSMLEGFGKQNCRIDQTRGYRQPKWRY